MRFSSQLALLCALALVALAAACDPPAEDEDGALFFAPGDALDLGRRPLSRIESAVIVARGQERVLSATAHFFATELVCNDDGCLNVVVERPEQLCVSLRAPFGPVACPATEAVFAPVEPIPPGVDTFFGHADRSFAAEGGLVLPEVSYFGVRASGLVRAEGTLVDDVPEAARFDLHLALVRRADGDTIDVAPEGVALGDLLVAQDVDGALGAGLVLRDGALVALDTAADGLAGAPVGEAYFDTNGGRSVAFARIGDEVIVVRATPSPDIDDSALGGLATPTPAVGLFVATAPAGGAASAPLRAFRAARAHAPTPASVVVCFNRRLDPASLEALSLSIPAAPASGLLDLLPGAQCVRATTGPQPPRAPLTISASGARSANGDALAPSTVTTESKPLRLESVAALYPRIAAGFDELLVPLGDGGVLHQSGDALLSDFVTVERFDAAGLLSTATFAFPPDAPGLWVAGAAGEVLFFDGGAAPQVYERAQQDTPLLHPLPGGRVVAVAGEVALLDGDAFVPIAPPLAALPQGAGFVAPVLDDDTYLWRAFDGTLHVRADRDGNVLDTFDPGVFAAWGAVSGGALFVFTERGLERLDVASGVEASTLTLVDEGHELSGVSVLDDGAIELAYSRFGAPPVVHLRDGALEEIDVPDPHALAPASLGAARFVGDIAFVRSFGKASAAAQARGGLRVLHRAHWQELVQAARDGGEP